MANKHYSWLIDPTSGDYELEKGSPIRDETLQFPAYARLKISQGAWLYAPDETYGSQFDLVKKKNTQAPQMLLGVAENALQPLVEDGRAVDIIVENADTSRHGVSLNCMIVGVEGEPIIVALNPVGI